LQRNSFLSNSCNNSLQQEIASALNSASSDSLNNSRAVSASLFSDANFSNKAKDCSTFDFSFNTS
jgi:hypothetical protein